MEKYYINGRSEQLVLSLLKAHGIRKVIASPGATNITLVASMQQDPYFEMYSSVDERSAAYMACGLAAESGEPIVLSCTGATASRNYMPGLTEAFYRKLPVIAITSLQGNFKLGHLIPQNIDRTTIPNDIVKVSVDVPTVKDDNDEWSNTVKINKALLEVCRNGGGPVHINLETTYSGDYSIKQLPVAKVINRIMPDDVFPELVDKKVAVFIGSHGKWTVDQEKAVDDFCASHDAVAFCDHTSGYKGKYRILFSLVATQANYRSSLLNVDVLIHIGEVSGDYPLQGIKSKEVWRVSEDGEIRDTFRKLRYVFEMPESLFFKHYSTDKENHTEYLDKAKEEYAGALSKLPDMPFSNIWMASKMSGKLPEKSVLHLGILNTLRSWNLFEIPKSVLSYCNVGAFGIDGGLSSLVGASLANKDKLYFGIVGDLAFFYDMNALGNHHIGKNLRVMLINNGRGTEFRNYGHPGAAFGDAADKYIAAAGHFGNKSKDLVKHYAEDLEFMYMTASNKEEFESKYETFLAAESNDKSILFEVFTDSKDESDALKIIRNYMVDSKTVVKNEMKTFIKKIVPDNVIDSIKKVVK